MRSIFSAHAIGIFSTPQPTTSQINHRELVRADRSST
jgi:hypothetical protein